MARISTLRWVKIDKLGDLLNNHIVISGERVSSGLRWSNYAKPFAFVIDEITGKTPLHRGPDVEKVVRLTRFVIKINETFYGMSTIRYE